MKFGYVKFRSKIIELNYVRFFCFKDKGFALYVVLGCLTSLKENKTLNCETVKLSLV